MTGKEPAGPTTDETILNPDIISAEVYQEIFDAAIKQAAKVGAEYGAKTALEVAENVRRKWQCEHFRKMFANTRLLLKYYRILNTYYESAVWEQKETDADEFINIMELMSAKHYPDTVKVDSIRKSSEKTRIIMQHVNKMLDVYKKMCEASGREDDLRNWRVIKALYLLPEKQSAEDVAEQEHIHERTVYKCVDAAVDDLTMFLFGVDGIEKLGK